MSVNQLERYDLMQKLGNRTPTPINGKKEEKVGFLEFLIVWIIGILLGMALAATLKECSTGVYNPCAGCHTMVIRKHSFTEYFKVKGSSHPEQMAEAVLATKKPRLLAAVAVAGEKNTPYTVRKGGYKNRHAGAWQVNAKHWGKVPLDPIGQALQAERILEDLTGEKKNIRTALSIYGGDSSSKYANRVLKELQEVPM